MSDQARRDTRLAWLIVGTSGTLTLFLLVLAAGWVSGQVSRWAAAQQREMQRQGGRSPDIFDETSPTTPLPEANTNSDTPLPVAEGPPPPTDTHPIGSAAAWIGSDDYPPSALRAGWEGRVQVTVAVDRAGSPTGCAVRRSSGHWSLDNATCAAMLNHGRFTLASHGPRIRHWTSPVIRWSMPKEGDATASKTAVAD